MTYTFNYYKPTLHPTRYEEMGWKHSGGNFNFSNINEEYKVASLTDIRNHACTTTQINAQQSAHITKLYSLELCSCFENDEIHLLLDFHKETIY